MLQRDLNPTAKLILITIAWHHNIKTGQCNPKWETLEFETGLGRSTIARQMKILKDVNGFEIKKYGRNSCEYVFDPAYFMQRTPATKTKRAQEKRTQGLIDYQFEKFYEIYPRKRAKVQAQKAWNAAKISDKVATVIIQDIQQRLEGEWKDKDPKWIPYPASYINQRRWLDIPDKPPKPPEPDTPHYL